MINAFLLTVVLLVSGCAKDDSTSPTEIPEIQEYFTGPFRVGTNESLDVMSWNIETFPKKYQTTVEYAARIILESGADITALQEINNSAYFNNIPILLNELDTLYSWAGYQSGSGLAYVLKSDAVTVLQTPFEIYEDDGYAFPREPYILEFLYEEQNFVLINNHLKAMSGSENEERRRLASERLQEYIDQFHPDHNVILVGDLNDEIQEPMGLNVFWNFIDDDQNYLFTDMEIANDNTHYQWSYPSWPSHLDHILITNELFDDFQNTGSRVKTIRVDDYLYNGWFEYESNVSDHRPVILKLVMQVSAERTANN